MDIYGLLREAWERGIEEVLLNDAVERYRPSVETQRIRHLHDITEQDFKELEDGMNECSRWMRGHDEAVAIVAPFPKPDKVKAAIDALENWANRIRKRRKA